MDHEELANKVFRVKHIFLHLPQRTKDRWELTLPPSLLSQEIQVFLDQTAGSIDRKFQEWVHGSFLSTVFDFMAWVSCSEASFSPAPTGGFSGWLSCVVSHFAHAAACWGDSASAPIDRHLCLPSASWLLQTLIAPAWVSNLPFPGRRESDWLHASAS